MKTKSALTPRPGKPGASAEYPKADIANTDLLVLRNLEKNKIRKTTALLGAFCMFLSTIEYMIPKPMPFMRIGIANLPIMLAIDILPFHSFILLATIKIFGQSLITGTLFSYVFIFSLTGTLLSALAMFSLRRALKPDLLGFIGTGVLGAMVSNFTQLAMAFIFVFGSAIKFLAPPFLAAGVVTGILLGIFCELFARQSQWYANHKKRWIA